MISKNSIDRVLSHAQVEEVVGHFVNLKKRGTNHVGLCPFHDERTPSFSVSPSKGIFKCFGCGKSGSVVNFLMEHEHFSYREAIRYLAEFYKIELEEDSSQEDIPKEDRERIYAALHYAVQFYWEQLNESDEGKNLALSYLHERGFKPGTISKFELGYSPDSWDAFLKSARKVGFEIEILEKAGLVSQAKNGNYIDRFRGRLMFPIKSMAGRALGFGARILGDKAKEPKYINTAETEVYDKSKALFGLYHAKKVIAQKEEGIVVEGYTDVLALHQQGFENTVSVSGTSLTEDHIRQLHRLTSRLLFIFDSDEAGHKAAERAIDLSLKQNMDVELVELPEGEDPGSFAMNHDPDGVRAYLNEHRQNFLAYKTEKARTENGNVQKASAISSIVSSIAVIPDPVRRELHVQELSNNINLSLETLFEELNRQVVKIKRQQRTSGASTENKEDQEPAKETKPEAVQELKAGREIEKWIFGWLMLYGDQPLDEDRTVASMLIEELQKVNISDDNHQQILDIYLSYLEKGEAPSLQEFIHHPDEKVQKLAAEFGVLSERELSDNWKKKYDIRISSPEENYTEEVTRTLMHFLYKKVNDLLDENREKIKEAEKNQDQETLTEHLEVQHYLHDMKKQYAEEIGATILK